MAVNSHSLQIQVEIKQILLNIMDLKGSISWQI